MQRSFILALTLAASTIACAQTSAPTPQPKPLPGDIATHPDWPQAKAEDVDTIDHLMASLYGVISGPAGQQRDWHRFRSLFLPTGRMGVIRAERPATKDQPARPADAVFLTPDDYVTRDDPFFKTNGFFERGLHNNVEEFGNLVSVWSTYESRHTLTDTQPFARGINSLQLVHAQGRYWIASILWDDERPGLTLPEKYLAK
ncbi:MAG: hypothetical protein V4555_14205 [Acidobacteriota bacterium]